MKKRGEKYTDIAVIMKLSADGEGSLPLEEFLTKEGRAGTIVKDKMLLSEKVRKRADSRYNTADLTGVSSVKKSISGLIKKEIIEKTRIVSGESAKPIYKLKCSNLYELSRIFNYIYDADNWVSNGYSRLEKFIESSFFFASMETYLLDIVYYFSLWDETKYPVNIATYTHFFSSKEALDYLPDSINHLSINFEGGGDYLITGNAELPQIWKRNFPEQGPAAYEKKLRELGVLRSLMARLLYSHFGRPMETSEIINFFKFLRKYMEIKKGENFREVEMIDFWFNSFWYGTIQRYVQDMENYYGKGSRSKLVSIIDSDSLFFGLHSFENFRPLKSALILKDDRYQPLRTQISSDWCHPGRYNDALLLPGYTYLAEGVTTKEGREFIRNTIESGICGTSFAPELIEYLEKMVRVPIKVFTEFSLEPYKCIKQGNMQSKSE